MPLQGTQPGGLYSILSTGNCFVEVVRAKPNNELPGQFNTTNCNDKLKQNTVQVPAQSHNTRQQVITTTAIYDLLDAVMNNFASHLDDT